MHVERPDPHQNDVGGAGHRVWAAGWPSAKLPGVTLDPPLQALFTGMAGRDPEPDDLDERRSQANATMTLIRPPVPDDVEVTEHDVAVAGGTVRVRVQRPSSVPVPAPCVYFVHGGGWFQGDLDTSEVECGPMATAVPAVVVTLAYRLAPEHPFPTPLDDVVAVYRWLLDHTDELGVDPARIAAAGTSAGGNLVAALCLVARERALPQPLLQLLDVPALDLTLASPSMQECSEGYGLTTAAVAQYVEWYVPDPDIRRHPHASPLLADDVTGLPPAVVLVAEHDPVRDDGVRWADKLREAGGTAACFRVTGHIHGSWIIPFTATSTLVQDLRAAALRRALHGDLVPGR